MTIFFLLSKRSLRAILCNLYLFYNKKKQNFIHQKSRSSNEHTHNLLSHPPFEHSTHTHNHHHHQHHHQFITSPSSTHFQLYTKRKKINTPNQTPNDITHTHIQTTISSSTINSYICIYNAQDTKFNDHKYGSQPYFTMSSSPPFYLSKDFSLFKSIASNSSKKPFNTHLIIYFNFQVCRNLDFI